MKHSTPRSPHGNLAGLAELADLPIGQMRQLRYQIATIAARYVTEDGATYAIAKQKAAQQVIGAGRIPGAVLPDTALIEQQILVHNQLFLSDRQPQRLLSLRNLALEIMQELAPFQPHLTGAVLNGTASLHDGIVIQLFVDNGKDVAIYLLNRGIRFDVSEARPNVPGRQEPVETLSFTHHDEEIHLVLLASDDLHRVSAKKSPRANISAVSKLIEESQSV